MNFRNKRVLVTGGDGFIGSHLVEHLTRTGAQVTALAQYNSFNDWGWLEEVPSLHEIKVVTGDIRDSHFCLTLLKGIDVVFHLAALIPIPYSYRAPDSYLDTNIRGTLNLCQAALACAVWSTGWPRPLACPSWSETRWGHCTSVGPACPTTRSVMSSTSPPCRWVSH